MFKKLNLTERSLSVHVIVESVRYLLNSHQLIRLRIQQRASKTTSTNYSDFIISQKRKETSKSNTHALANFNHNRIRIIQSENHTISRFNQSRFQNHNKSKKTKQYQTIPYAPRPIGMIGGRYFVVTSKRLPNMLY